MLAVGTPGCFGFLNTCKFNSFFMERQPEMRQTPDKGLLFYFQIDPCIESKIQILPVFYKKGNLSRMV